ncbi:MAG: alkaline phosphatase [Phycisphaerae bacterium]|nr:alkaline phosphatase [Phycisphaerae bacterium]
MKKLNSLMLVLVLLFICGCNTKVKSPKNVILFISDGCGFNHVQVADYYQYGQEGQQSYEKFPVKLAAQTFPFGGSYDEAKAWSDFGYVKKSPTDSAAAATALSSGSKTQNGKLNIGNDGNKMVVLTDYFEKLNKSTGVVTSVMFAHATPAGFVAHNESRNNYLEISNEMINESPLEVIMGCGHPLYKTKETKKDEKADFNYNTVETNVLTDKPDYKYTGSKETWENLLKGKAGADADNDGKADSWTLIQDRNKIQKLATGDTPKRLLAVPRSHSTLQQSRLGDNKADAFAVRLNENMPTLAEMTNAALNVLDNDPDGFFVMIEGGAVDWAAHGNQSGRVIEEMIDFNLAVDAAVKWVEKNSSWDETLIIVTADHETGYLTGLDSDKKPYFKPIKNNGKGKMPGFQWNSGGHTNSLVPVYAKGPGSKMLKKSIIGKDPERGEYIDNTAISDTIVDLLK